jgi:hypothetical protein
MKTAVCRVALLAKRRHGRTIAESVRRLGPASSSCAGLISFLRGASCARATRVRSEETMYALDEQAPPEQLIAELHRRRHWKMFGAIAGVVIALGALFGAALAMYSEEVGGGLPPPAATLAER